MFLYPLLPIFPEWRRRYLILRVILYVVIVVVSVIFFNVILYPTLSFSYDFHASGSTKNNLDNPRTADDASLKNGTVGSGTSLVIDAGAVGDFSRAHLEMTFENESPLPPTLSASIRRSYRGFFLPIGTPLSGFPSATLFSVNDIYYTLRDGTLFPFVSANAFHSRYPEHFATTETTALFDRFPVSRVPIGFRVGTLISDATGIYVVASENEIDPIGSVDIFLALGYDFKNVIPVDEEEQSLYTRGKILRLGSMHPDGTLFLDADTGNTFILDHGSRRPILDADYLAFLKERQTPISASTKSAIIGSDCLLKPRFFGHTSRCDLVLSSLRPEFGNDFRITINNQTEPIELSSIALAIDTSRTSKNLTSILSQFKSRLLLRFGYGDIP